MKYCSNKDINKLIRMLVRQGWRFKHGTKHGCLCDPSGSHGITVAKSPSDYRSYKNFICDLRRLSRNVS